MLDAGVLGGARWAIGIDTGGTFTDLVAVSEDGEVRLRKVSSTPSQPAWAVFAALERTGLDLERDLEQLVLGTTIATNAVLERSGVAPLFLTTAGFEDLLYIQRIDRRGLYDLQWVKTTPLAPSHNTIGVVERVLSDGSVLVDLAEEELDRVVSLVAQRLSDPAPPAAVAISLLFSYVNDVHERRIGQRLAESVPRPLDLLIERSGADLAGVRALQHHRHRRFYQADCERFLPLARGWPRNALGQWLARPNEVKRWPGAAGPGWSPAG